MRRYISLLLFIGMMFGQEYDPETGEVVKKLYHPETGEVVIKQYDPETGELIKDQNYPDSLVSPSQAEIAIHNQQLKTKYLLGEGLWYMLCTVIAALAISIEIAM